MTETYYGPAPTNKQLGITIQEDKNEHLIDKEGNLIFDERCYVCTFFY